MNGDGVVDDYDKCLIGQGDVPKIYYGFGADLQVGNFSIGAIFSGTAKADRCLSGDAVMPFSDASGISNLYSNIDECFLSSSALRFFSQYEQYKDKYLVAERYEFLAPKTDDDSV